MRGYAAPEGLMSIKTASRPISLGWLLLEPGASYRAKPWVARLPPRARRKASPKATSTVAPRLAGDSFVRWRCGTSPLPSNARSKERAMLRSGLADISIAGRTAACERSYPGAAVGVNAPSRLSPAFLRCLTGGAFHVESPRIRGISASRWREWCRSVRSSGNGFARLKRSCCMAPRRLRLHIRRETRRTHRLIRRCRQSPPKRSSRLMSNC